MPMKSKLYMILKKLSERKSRQHFKDLYRNEYKFFDSDKDKKSASLMKKEMRILHKYWGCYPFQYIRYGMYKKSCKMSMEEMKTYVPNFFLFYLFFPRFYKDYFMVSEDKELFYRVLDSMKISQPTLLLQYKEGVFYDKNKNTISAKEADQIIVESKAEKLFFKPTLGLGGNGIIVFNKKDHYCDKMDNRLTAELIIKLVKDSENYLLQEGVVQHDEINQIYPHALNTFRIYTEYNNGKARILNTYFRMGQGGNQVDNASQKGFVCGVNSTNGSFAPFATSKLFAKIDRHPDTKFIYKNYTFPFWNEIQKFVLTSTEKLEKFRYIGWDIAYSKDGPLAIEINASPGPHSLQDCFGGAKEMFGIKDPKKYWYNRNFVIKDV